MMMTGLVACSGNNSSTTVGAPIVISPISIDKTIGAVNWDKNNEVEMASHAYRSIARNSMLAAVYSGQSAVFQSFITLVKGSRDLQCAISGSIDADESKKVCSDKDKAEVSCTVKEGEKVLSNLAVKLSTTEQRAIFYRCQNGSTAGLYFNGPLKTIVTEDYLTEGTYKSSTTISAVSQVNQLNESGDFVLDVHGDFLKEPATDFLFQNDINTIVISQDYKLTTQFDNRTDRLSTRKIEECTTSDKFVKNEDSGEMEFHRGTAIVTQEELSTEKVAALQSPSPQLSYTEYSNLQLTALKSNFRCEDLNSSTGVINESLRFDTTYSLTTNVASKAIGEKTVMKWERLVIPTNQKKIEGKITLTHTNADDSSYEVVVNFDAAGNLTVNDGPQMGVQEFLDLSKAAKISVE